MKNLPEDVDLVGVPVGDEPAVEMAPTKPPATPGEWVRQNLFSSTFNSILTVVVGFLVLYGGFSLLKWLITEADWTVFKVNARLYMTGRFPEEELWRVWAVVYLVAALFGLSYGVYRARSTTSWRARAPRLGVGAALALVVLLYVVETPLVLGLIAVLVALVVATAGAGRRLGRRIGRALLVGWIVAFPLIIVMLRAFDGVPPREWGGFVVLNLIVAVVGISASFPIGILLALGRRSSLPAVRTFCVGAIELVRGVPLVTLLIFGQFVLPLLILTELPAIIRAMFMFTIFSAAYVAEIVRGGLQGIPTGQYEAARALGLSTTRTMALIALPQALRSTIPAMISHFISLFKDTSLLAAIGFLELLSAARIAARGNEFVGDIKEALIPAALMFWIVAFSMSRWSQRLETRLGVGER